MAMKRVGVVEFNWTASPSPDIATAELELNIGGLTTKTTLNVADVSYRVNIDSGKSGWYRVTVFDTAGNKTASEQHFFDIDLDAPLPVTNLTHTIVDVIEVEVEEEVPPS